MAEHAEESGSALQAAVERVVTATSAVVAADLALSQAQAQQQQQQQQQKQKTAAAGSSTSSTSTSSTSSDIDSSARFSGGASRLFCDELWWWGWGCREERSTRTSTRAACRH
jgi:hypothetical protein